jgi:hypothetical protein
MMPPDEVVAEGEDEAVAEAVAGTTNKGPKQEEATEEGDQCRRPNLATPTA